MPPSCSLHFTLPPCLWLEVYIKNTIPNILSTMWAFGVVVSNPGTCDVMQMIYTEAHEVIQAFTFQRTDKRFTEGVCLWRSDGRFDRGDILVFPERFHRVGILSISITKEELCFKSLIFEPHGSIAALLNYPIAIRM